MDANFFLCVLSLQIRILLNNQSTMQTHELDAAKAWMWSVLPARPHQWSDPFLTL